MPITEKATIRSKCTFSKDRKHKFLLTLEWEEKKPKAVVIMTSPAEANCIVTDLTTSLVIKNLHALGYGGCDLVNLGSKLHFNKLIVDKTEEDYNKENQEVIQRCVADEKNEKTIIAWGSCGEGNKRIQAYQKILLEKISDYQDKLFVIQDGRGKKGLHPLTPSIRNRWELVPFQIPKSQNQPSEQPTPPDVATVEEKPQESEVSAKEAPENQQSEETAE
ncbi:hypothetical protein CLNEO_19140 [Anaerotignum neopropionicum]|uniref:DUF1643 domain-containing protein n=1 Tax=Anaerotignum neopropionicum TaxID=36847 RepID=A0A136WEF3_9FIRM|nr:DUF1643 domain-containing protein [Anaerotignum neopropionicum]KXL52890.1 hypothetical protein CLNEO_19140 [Anaerotignum neopropionicum]